MVDNNDNVVNMGIRATINRLIQNNSDPRTKNWFMMQNFEPLLAIVVIYVVFCKILGPKMMKNRQPFELKNTIIAYNLFNLVVSVWLMFEFLASGWWFDYNYKCQTMDHGDNPKAKRMTAASWMYFVCKLIELLETVIFVLRKKDNQVSLLHVYHHVTVLSLIWMLVKLSPDGHLTFGMPINCFIHAVMYTYYLLSSLGPQFQKYLWWKKYLTLMQLTQFVVIAIHNSQLFIYDCDYPKLVPALSFVNMFVFFYLFSMFYKKSYVRKEIEVKKQS